MGAKRGVNWSTHYGPLFIGGLWERGAWDLGGINSHWFLGDLGGRGGPSLPQEGIMFVGIACLRSA